MVNKSIRFFILIYYSFFGWLICDQINLEEKHLNYRQLNTEYSNSNCNPKHHNYEQIQLSKNKAIAKLDTFDKTVSIADRLAVMILFSRGFHASTVPNHHSNRLDYLQCSLLQLINNLSSNTTLDIYIWALNTSTNPIIIPSWLLNKDKFPRVMIMEIEPISWLIPCGLVDDSEWVVRKKFDLDYYLMGRWRLTYSLDFVKEMGYKYHLQFDDDAIINSKIKYNIVHELQRKATQMGVFSDLIGEVAHVVHGLPELSYFWIKLRHYTPKGEIFKNVNPHDLSGLTSEGWNRMYHPGYFMIISIDFWYSNEVQDYLTTILRSGKDVEGRWQEQAVMNMIRLVFVPKDNLWVMNDVDIGHDRHKRANFENWCVKSGVMPLSST
eukprot:gene5286-7347_t